MMTFCSVTCTETLQTVLTLVSGLVDRKVTYEDDVLLLKSYGLGFTNLTPKVSRRASDLTVAEQLDNAPLLTEKIKVYRPKWVVFIGMGMYQLYSGQKKVDIGLQAKTIPWKDRTGSSNIFVMPSTSGLVAAYHKKDKVK
jgi:mismatch-specific thymine-DNA glycosylase